MAAASTPEKINEERRKREYIGTLPPDFLRISDSTLQQQESVDQQTAIALQQQMYGSPFVQNPIARLNITVEQAKLVKNYGMTRMDPYVRLRVGHCVYETHTDPNGGMNPRWNKVIQCPLPQGVNSVYLEIYDKCFFTMDELIAWAKVPIPQVVMSGETHEDWYALSGKQGDGVEGMINLVLSFSEYIGTLPPDFLRISDSTLQQQESVDQQTAIALQQQMYGSPFVQNPIARLNITVGQAKLVENYGMTRMDPYVRLRVGHCVYETHTDPNGGKNPRWNIVMQCPLPQGVNSVYLEIYDKCSFTMDELIAWAKVPIPQVVMSGETPDDWYALSGKQGDGVEGMINLVLSFSSGPVNPYFYPTGSTAPYVMVPNVGTGSVLRGATPVQVYTQPTPPPQHTNDQLFSEQDFKQIEEMFPNMDKEVIKSVYEANRFNKNGTVNCLLQMAD